MIGLALLGCAQVAPVPTARWCDDMWVVEAPGVVKARPAGTSRWYRPTADRGLFVAHGSEVGTLDVVASRGRCELTVAPPHDGPVDCAGATFRLTATALCTLPATRDYVDRLGRPEITNFLVARKLGRDFTTEDDRRPGWNAHGSGAMPPPVAQALDLGLARLDLKDGAVDWPSPHPLREWLLEDALLVDPTQLCTVDAPTFFEIESAARAGRPHVTCGGRTPNDDVVDRLLTLLVNGPDRVPPGPPLYGPDGALAPIRRDGVDRPGAPSVDTWPYLRDPRD